MAERYGVPPKRFTKEWWPHYWMYYKWHTIAGAFAAIMIVTTAVQCATREKFDMNVTYTGSVYFPDESIDMLETEMEKYIDDIASRRKTMVSTGDRSAKIRTYNYPQGRITDHRINYTIYNLNAFVNGNIQDCIDHLIIAENAERMKEQEL